MIGFAASAWAFVARLLGGIRGIPGWKARNKGPGQIIDNTNNKTHPQIIIESNVRYADYALPPEEVQRAIDMQRERFLRHLEFMLRAAARKSGL
jgi:hypothetical protein